MFWQGAENKSPARRLLPVRVIRVIRGELLLRRERDDDFFEARIAPQRVPPWHQF
jgi:hypothetical protein